MVRGCRSPFCSSRQPVLESIGGLRLYRAVLSPADERQLLDVGVGVTNLVPTATRSAAEVTATELRAGVAKLKRKVRRWHPAAVAVLGLDAYRTGFGARSVIIGRQPEAISGAQLWVIPNPSGIQAHYPFDRLVAEMRASAAVKD